MRRVLAALSIALGVAACGSVQSIDDSFNGLKGQSLASAIARLGPPASQQTSANGAATIWTDRVRDDSPVPMQQTIYENGRARTVEVMARPEPGIVRTCILSVQSDAAGRIVAVDRNGTSAACAPLARRAAA